MCLDITISVCRIKKVRKPAMIVVAMINKIFEISSSRITEIATFLSLEKDSITLNDLLINFGVNKENIWAIMVNIIPREKLYLYLTKYLFK
jgi:hypothetical protein